MVRKLDESDRRVASFGSSTLMVQGVVIEKGHIVDVNPATGQVIARGDTDSDDAVWFAKLWFRTHRVRASLADWFRQGLQGQSFLVNVRDRTLPKRSQRTSRVVCMPWLSTTIQRCAADCTAHAELYGRHLSLHS